MNIRIKSSFYYLLIAVAMLLALRVDLLYAETFPNPKERIDYWRNNYTELQADKDARVLKAQQIFDRVLRAAGNRYGVIPRLHIIEENPFNVVLPVSIPDGWVIISKKVLDMSYHQKRYSEDRLAFVLAHEIAHLLDDDFWHISFFSALELLKANDAVKPNVLNELKGIFEQTAKIQAKELRADERGILYTAMAGFNPNAIVKSGEPGSFFHQWQRMLNLPEIKGHEEHNTHPSSSQRSAAVLARLQKVSDEADLFKLGLIFYQTGNFGLATRAFSDFMRYFPSREVYHNLAASHHQLALLHYEDDHLDKHLLPFRLPIMADPYSRAAYGVSRAAADDKQRFKQHIGKAIKYYEASIQQDENYTIAYLNLASAYIANKEPYKAIATLQDVYKKHQNNAMLMNALGVGFYQTGNSKEAIKYLRLATAAAPDYDAPYYNLGKIAYLANRPRDAVKQWEKFVALDINNRWARFLISNYDVPVKRRRVDKARSFAVEEQIKGIQIGHYLDEVPASWGNAKVKQYRLDKSVYTLADYNNGVTLVLEGDEIRIVVATPDYKGKSSQGVKVGSNARSIVSGYGNPGMTLQSTQGDSLVYPREGITFQMQKNKVISWMVY